MGEILTLHSLGFIWIVSTSERLFPGQIFIKIEEKENRVGSLKEQQKWKGRSWTPFDRARLQVANQQDEKILSTPAQLVARSRGHTDLGDTNFSPVTDPAIACVSHGSVPAEDRVSLLEVRPSSSHSSSGLRQLDKAGPGRVWAMLGDVTEAPGQTETLWTSVPCSSPSCLHLGCGFYSRDSSLIKAEKGQLFTSVLFSAFVNLLYNFVLQVGSDFYLLIGAVMLWLKKGQSCI